MRRGAVPLKNLKNHLRTTSECLAVVSEQESVVFTLTPNLSNVIITNPVLGKNLEHPPLNKVV